MLNQRYFAPLVGLVVALLTFAGGEFLIRQEQARLVQDQRDRVVSQVGEMRAALESELNSTLYLTNGLVAYVLTQSTLEPAVAEAMLMSLGSQGRHVRNIGLAPGNRLTYVYPLKGNESVIGLYYPDVPEQWPAIQRAMADRQPTLAGPLPLKQGGMGLIYRVPVFERNNSRYWGMLSMVIDSQSLFERAQVAPSVNGLQVAIRGQDGLGPQGATFLGAAALFDADPVTATVRMPGGTWQLAARPQEGWGASGRVLGWRGIVLGVALVLGFLLFETLASLARRLRAEQDVRISHDALREAQRIAQMGSWVLNFQSKVVTWSDQIYRMLGVAPGQALRFDDSVQRVHPEDRAVVAQTWRKALEQRGMSYDIEYRVLVNGEERWVHEQSDVRRAPNGAPVEAMGTLMDITDRKHAELERNAAAELVRQMAYVDALTNLPNRRLLLDRLTHAVTQAKRFGRSLAVLFLDLDRFKQINDAHGHGVGDALLQAVAHRLQHAVRHGDTVARQAGDEFVIVLTEIHHPLEAAKVARKVIELLSEPLCLEGLDLAITTSIGIAVYAPGRDSDVNALLKQADTAMYLAKSEGRNRVEFFDPQDRV